jgi:hypothetical protein
MKSKDGIRPTSVAKIKRFPSLPKGTDVAKLATSVWATPTFTANEVKGVTKFVFSIPLRDKIRSHNEILYRSLFESRGTAWDTALETAYVSARSGKKTVAEYINTTLYIVFRDALQILMEDSRTLSRNYDESMRYKGEAYRAVFDKNIDDQVKNFASNSDRKKGRKRIRPIDETRSIRLAERYASLEPGMVLLRQSVNELRAKGVQNESVMRTEIGKAFKEYDWINHVVSGSAFLELPQNASVTVTTQSSLGREWTPEQLTMGILKCEHKMLHRGRPVSVLTILKMVAHGKKLLENPEVARR